MGAAVTAPQNSSLISGPPLSLSPVIPLLTLTSSSLARPPAPISGIVSTFPQLINPDSDIGRSSPSSPPSRRNNPPSVMPENLPSGNSDDDVRARMNPKSRVLDISSKKSAGVGRDDSGDRNDADVDIDTEMLVEAEGGG